MAKTIVKELIIVLLLCLAIILLLSVLLYDYMPMSKTLPNPVSYSTAQEVKQELAEGEEIDENQIIMSYEIDANDLNNYRRVQNYRPGKANPFSSYETTNVGSGSTDTAGGGTTSGETGSSSGGGYLFKDKETK